MPRPPSPDSLRFMAANVSGKTHVSFLFFFFPGKAHFFGVDNDHKIARVHMGSEDGFAFAAQQVCSFYRDLAQHLVLGVDEPPFAGNLAGFGGKSFHTEEKSTETTNAKSSCQLAPACHACVLCDTYLPLPNSPIQLNEPGSLRAGTRISRSGISR